MRKKNLNKRMYTNSICFVNSKINELRKQKKNVQFHRLIMYSSHSQHISMHIHTYKHLNVRKEYRLHKATNNNK